MSSPSAQSEKPSRSGLFKPEMSPAGWWGAPRHTPLYSAVPDVSPDFYSGFGPTPAAIYDFLGSPKNGAVIHEDHSWHCDAPSLDEIARRMRGGRRARSTIWRGIKDLVESKSLQVRKVYYKDRKGGRIMRTIYYGPPWKKALEERRKIPGVILTAAGHPIVFGRRRKPITAEKAAAYHVKPECAPASPRRRPSPGRPPAQPSVTDSVVPRNSPLAEMPVTNQMDEAAVLAKLLEYCPANAADARDVLAAARGDARDIPTAAVLAEIDSIHDRKVKLQQKGDRRPENAGWFLNRMPSHADHWRTREAAQAREREKAARYQREQAINLLAQAISQLDRANRDDGRTAPLDPEEREFYQEIVAAADPEQLAEARALLVNSRTQSA